MTAIVDDVEHIANQIKPYSEQSCLKHEAEERARISKLRPDQAESLNELTGVYVFAFPENSSREEKDKWIAEWQRRYHELIWTTQFSQFQLDLAARMYCSMRFL